jgi:hypothetical protein
MSNEYYTGIEFLPFKLWLRASGGDLTALRLSPDKGDEENDRKAWGLCINDFIKRVGLSEEYAELLELYKLRAELCVQYLESRERFILNQINEYTAKIAKFAEDEAQSVSVYKCLDILSKQRGYTVRLRCNILKC